MRKNIARLFWAFTVLLTLMIGWPSTSNAQIPTAQFCAEQKAFQLASAVKLRDDSLRGTVDPWTAAKIWERYNIQAFGIQNQYDKCMLQVKLYNDKPPL